MNTTLDTPFETTAGGDRSALQAYAPVQTAGWTIGLRVRMLAWSIVQATIFRLSPQPARAFRRMLLRAFGATVAPAASVNNKCRIDCPWNLTIERYASIGEHAWIYALDRITIRQRACVGQHVFLLTGSHDYSDPAFRLVTKPIEVGAGAWVATRATVLPGVRIGAMSVIGAGSVVAASQPDQCICAGNPCKPLRPRTLR